MSTMQIVLIAGALAVGCGGSGPANQPDAPPGGTSCAGGTPPAPGYPALSADCPSHVVFRTRGGNNSVDFESDVGGDRGTRTNGSLFEFGTALIGQDYILVLYTPSMEPGRYRSEDGAQVKSSLITTYDSASEGAALVEIDGKNASAAWGKFTAHACTYDFQPPCELFNGTFAVALEAGASDGGYGLPAGPHPSDFLLLCFDQSDCDMLPPCVQSACSAGGGSCEVSALDNNQCGTGVCTLEGCI